MRIRKSSQNNDRSGMRKKTIRQQTRTMVCQDQTDHFYILQLKSQQNDIKKFFEKENNKTPKISYVSFSPTLSFFFFVILIFIHLCPFLVYYLSCYNHRIYKAQHTTLISLLFFPFYIVKCIISIFRPFARILLSTAVNSSCAELFFRY